MEKYMEEVTYMSNDKKILELKNQIKEKREKLKSIGRFTPVTNCILDLDGVKSNIQVLKKDQLVLCACQLQSYKHSAKELGYELKINGFTIDDWLKDIVARIDILSVKEEETKLKAMEDKLSTLLSNRKKVELEIEAIESMLK